MNLVFILGQTITKYLFSRYHIIYNQMMILTQLKNKLVNGDTLGYLASKLDLTTYNNF